MNYDQDFRINEDDIEDDKLLELSKVIKCNVQGSTRIFTDSVETVSTKTDSRNNKASINAK